MFRRSGHRFADKNMRSQGIQSMIPKSGNRFPAFAKPASAGGGRSDKIVLKNK
jgi:hypothetical protein